MTSAGVRVQVSGADLPVTFVNGAAPYFAASVPVQSGSYSVTVLSESMSGTVTATVSFVTTARGQVVQATCADAGGSPVEDVLITARYSAGGGAGDQNATDPTGAATLYLQPSTYSLSVSAPGFTPVIVQNFQVLTGISSFSATGGTVPSAHVVRDQMGNPLDGVWVKLVQQDLAPAVGLVANVQSSGGGAWSVPVVAGKSYVYTFEAPGKDMRKFLAEPA